MMLERDPYQPGAVTVLADAVAEQTSADEVLTRVCRPLAEERGLLGVTITCLAPGGGLAALGGHPAPVRDLTRRHVERGESPCVDCCRSGEAVVVDDLRRDGRARWPSWTRAATAAGVVRVCSEPITLDRRVIGAASMLGGTGRWAGFGGDPGLWAVARVAAAYAVAVSSYADARELTGQLQKALDSRVRIEQAKGVLAAHLGIGVDEAFECLRQSSRNRNRRLHEVANEVVERLAVVAAVPRAGRPHEQGLRVTPTPAGLRLGGVADFAAASSLEAALERLDPASATTVDLRDVAFLDAHCARLLLEAADRLPAGAVLTLLGPNPGVSRVLDLLGARRHPRLRLVRPN